jgi:hypothetical protein
MGRLMQAGHRPMVEAKASEVFMAPTRVDVSFTAE